jgi:hypothetical protein
MEQKQLQDEPKKAHSKGIPIPLQTTELELDIWTFLPKSNYCCDFLGRLFFVYMFDLL